MENNYFTPDIEDIRVGYECECLWQRPDPKTWDKIEITETDTEEYLKLSVEEVIRRVKSNEIRVPYLTKEQIEAEGWVFDKIYLGDVYYKRLGYSMCHFLSQKRISITRESSDTKWYMGECKDINTFRYICKLLNIK